jgi:hypothetical protein
MEADLIVHGGGAISGAYPHTLVLTAVATAWTECSALRHRTQAAVIIALDRARQLLPFPPRGFDTDNGGEFLNAELIASCARDGIAFTRGRSYHKDDRCFAEPKNGAVVRHLAGYGPFHERAQPPPAHRAVPGGAAVRELLPAVDEAAAHAAAWGWTDAAIDACATPTPADGGGTSDRPSSRRDGWMRRRPRKPLGRRTDRTRPDPFAMVWSEVEQRLAADPEQTARSVLAELARRYPGSTRRGSGAP